MAMYEDLGYCPSDAFREEENSGCTSYFWEKTKGLLGDRIEYMVYCSGYKGAHGYLVDALMHGNGTLGIEVAAALKTMMPKCSYKKVGRLITLHDFDGAPYPWETDRVTFEDHRYMLALEDDGKHIQVTTYKK